MTTTMKRMGTRGAAVVLAALLAACGSEPPSFTEPVQSVESLRAHSTEFEKGVVQVTEGVHMAIGYGLANSIMVEGDDGVIIIDTMETLEEGREVREAFRTVVDKPVRAIIYTHNHTDHVFGAQAFVDEGVTPEVFAHADTMDYVYRIITEFRPIVTRRSMRMFGNYLDDGVVINNGIGPFLGIGPDSELGILPPTQTFEDRMSAEVAGVRFELVHAPGETNDQLFVWFPDLGVLAPGDNLYKTFPNLYTIRGTPYRSLKGWAESIDKMRALPIEHLVPSHTRPLSGKEQIHQTLTDYRDGIRFVYDQTVRLMNQGATPDEIAEQLTLPPHLAESPYLQEFYGTVEWSARSVFAGNLGWFDGNPSQLQPLSPGDHAARMADLAGGKAALRDQVLASAEAGDHQWVLQLSDHALRLYPDDSAITQARIDALTHLGEQSANPNARHYYLTSALELRGLEIPVLSNAGDEMLARFPLSRFFAAIPVNLDAAAALELDQKVGFSFTDSDETFTIWVRRGVAEVRDTLMEDLDIHVAVDSLVFKQMLAQQRNPAVTIAKDFEYRDGGRVAFARFMRLFMPPE
ncbi:alkyl sulfatase dimerization domain-containing protein [Algiphilus sp.]|uniref:alkyl sulfatase dimerization domain-containing protein n=1 Tax=Algiphilus sp. TaxID=1872431 RepID=UPI003B52C4BD